MLCAALSQQEPPESCRPRRCQLDWPSNYSLLRHAYTIMGLQPTGATRVTLEVIIPHQQDWLQKSGTRLQLCAQWMSRRIIASSDCGTPRFHQYTAQLKQQIMQHRHMVSHWEINRIRFASGVLFQRPAHCAPEVQHVREREFSDRRLRKKTPSLGSLSGRLLCNWEQLDWHSPSWWTTWPWRYYAGYDIATPPPFRLHSFLDLTRAFYTFLVPSATCPSAPLSDLLPLALLCGGLLLALVVLPSPGPFLF